MRVRSFSCLMLIATVACGGRARPEPAASPSSAQFLTPYGVPTRPFSPAVRVGNMLYLSGQIGTADASSASVVPGGIEPETRQTLENIKNILDEAGSGFDRAVQSFVYMTDLSEFGQMNQVYAEYFKVNAPGRTTVGVTALPAGARIEITVTALA